MKNFGIWGGTFNPFHIGHLRAAEYILKSFPISKLYIIPNKIPPHKSFDGPDGETRLELISRAVENLPNCEVSDIELRRQGVSYTIDTLKELLSENPGFGAYLFIGTDMILGFSTVWKSSEEIANLCKIRVLCRNDEDKEAADAECGRLEKLYGGDIKICENPVTKVSSTQIREMLAKGEIPENLLPLGAIKYIREKKLYGIS